MKRLLLRYGLWLRRNVTRIDDHHDPLYWDGSDTFYAVLMTVLALLLLLVIGSCSVAVTL